MAYATATQLISRYDVRKIGQLVRDNNTQATAVELASDVVVVDAVEDASAQIRSAATINNKYTEDDLGELASNDDAFLVRLTCDLAMGYLMNRRGLGIDALPAQVMQAQEWLAALRLGERILNVARVRQYGNVQRRAMTNQDWQDTGLVADVPPNRYFPSRGR